MIDNLLSIASMFPIISSFPLAIMSICKPNLWASLPDEVPAWAMETACQLVAPYNGWTIAFLCQLYVTLLCFTLSEPFILHDFVQNQHEIGLDHDLFWVY